MAPGPGGREEQPLKWPKPATVLVVLSLICSVAAFVLLETGKVPYRVYVVHTGSMSPGIPPESAVVVREGQYRVGEVVSFTEHGEVVSHRLEAIRPDGTIVTKGDANRSVDPWRIPTSNVIGGVVAAPRHLGYFLTYLKTPQGAGSILVTLLCLWQIWSLAGELGGAGAGEGSLDRGVARLVRRGGRSPREWPSGSLLLPHQRR